jgi:hypothetical protein
VRQTVAIVPCPVGSQVVPGLCLGPWFLDGRCVVFHGAVRQFFLVVLVFFIYVTVCVLDEGVVMFAPMIVMIAPIVFDNVFLGRLLIFFPSGVVFVIARGFVWGFGFFSAKKGLVRSFVFLGVLFPVKLLRIAVVVEEDWCQFVVLLYWYIGDPFE